MTVSLLEIAARSTPAQVLALLLHWCTMAGLPATAWQPGSVPRALLEGESVAHSDALNLVAAIANGNVLDLSFGEWLTELAKNVYQLDRKVALFARGTVRIANNSGSVQSFPAQSLLAASTQSGTPFRIMDAIVGLAHGASIEVMAQAEEAGLSGNVAASSIDRLLTPYPGVSVSNVGVGGAWLTQIGTPEEDDVSLKIRCRARWPQLGGGPTILAYQGWALSRPQVARARVFPNVPGSGKIKIIVAGATNPLPGTVVDDVQAYVEPRAGQCVLVDVDAATAFPIVVIATIHVLPAFLATTVVAANDALRALVASKDVGERLNRDEITEALMSVSGARKITYVAPSGDTLVPPTGIAALLAAPAISVAVAPQ